MRLRAGAFFRDSLPCYRRLRLGTCLAMVVCLCLIVVYVAALWLRLETEIVSGRSVLRKPGLRQPRRMYTARRGTPSHPEGGRGFRRDRRRLGLQADLRGGLEAVLGWHYLSNARHNMCCVFVGHVKDHHNLLNYSPLLKNTCVRQVVLDKWFPLP